MNEIKKAYEKMLIEGYQEVDNQKALLRKYIDANIGKKYKYDFKRSGGKDRYWSSNPEFNIYIDNNSWVTITFADGTNIDVGIGGSSKLPKMLTDKIDKALKG